MLVVLRLQSTAACVAQVCSWEPDVCIAIHHININISCSLALPNVRSHAVPLFCLLHLAGSALSAAIQVCCAWLCRLVATTSTKDKALKRGLQWAT